jgi:diguanylate cyclase (GGDEF)-like protein
MKDYFRAKLLANRTNRVFRASISIFFYASVGTILAGLVYLLCGLTFLSLFVIFSGLIFMAALFIYIKGYYKSGIVVALVAVSTISVAGDAILGVGCGAHYFLMAGVMLFISVDKTTVIFRYVSGIACFVEFILICIFLTGTPPVTSLPSITVSIIDKINLLTAFGAIGFTLHHYVNAIIDKETIQKEQSLRLIDQANSDQLTGLPNRRFTYRQLEFLAVKSKTRNQEFVIGMADIDNFKRFNDTYGHLCGDEVLVQAGTVMKNTMRKSDIIGRWGGEEFLIILPNTGLDEGFLIIERLRTVIEESSFIIEGKKMSITMTIGVSVFKENALLEDVIRQTDMLLYNGKSKGKNCTVASLDRAASV